VNIDCPDFTPNLPNAGKHFRVEVGAAHPVQAGILLRADSLHSRNKQKGGPQGTAGFAAQAFSLWTVHGPFLFFAEKRNGGCNIPRRSAANPPHRVAVQFPAP